jgi:adenine phosphoribosyltransferase
LPWFGFHGNNIIGWQATVEVAAPKPITGYNIGSRLFGSFFDRFHTMPIKSKIRAVPHYPKPGVIYRDITTLLKDGPAFRMVIEQLAARYANSQIAKIAAIESRGFIFGAALAYELRAGFVPIRKKGKLPAPTIGFDYELEYGMDRIEIHLDAISPGERVLVIDDLIATGGTAEAAVKLLKKMGAEVIECAFVIDLPDLGGRHRLEHDCGQQVFAVTTFANE